MKVLLATDGSVFSKEMVKEFAGRTFAPNTKVHIISIYEMPGYIMNLAPMGALDDYNIVTDKYLLKSAQDAVEDAAKTIREKNNSLSVSTAAIQGSAKHIILEEAETFEADLIVVGSHGYGAVDRFLLGSVSQSVALHAKCSVEIVRKAPKRHHSK